MSYASTTAPVSVSWKHMYMCHGCTCATVRCCSSVAAKFGVNLRKKKEEGKFIFVDGLSDLVTAHFSSTDAKDLSRSRSTSDREGTNNITRSSNTEEPTLSLDRYRIVIKCLVTDSTCRTGTWMWAGH